jgi:integrase
LGGLLINILKREQFRKKNYLFDIIYPVLGGLPVSAITPRLILEKVLRPIEAEGKNETTKRVKSLLSLIFRYGVASGQAESDPTRDLRGALLPVQVTHRPTITNAAQVGGLLTVIRSYTGTPAVAYGLKILPYVFVRPGELRHAEWGEFDFKDGLWRIPAGKMKMRSPHLVPLATQVLALLEELKEFTCFGPYLFPGARSPNRPMSDMALSGALQRLGYAREEICPHGFRGMASTLLNEQGFPG